MSRGQRGRPVRGISHASNKWDDLPELLDLWNRASASTYGIKIKTSKRQVLYGKLYKARQNCGHADFDRLKIVLPPAPDELWIMYR